ncbi:MAG TPA: ABC transporter permease [Bryobacteraceae bacterium]|nr:ABC transporter permease [Bryobacteraceae bacterium]
MTSLLQDLRYALRLCRAKPGFTLMVLLTLALGIGVNVVMFTVVETALLRPLPYPQADRLVELTESSRDYPSIPVAYPNFQDWRRQSAAFENMSALALVSSTLADQAGARRIPAAQVSASFFDVLDLPPSMGRNFQASDDRTGAPTTAIVTHGFWLREMNGDPAPIGKSIQLDRRPYTVIGVLPAEFRFYRESEIFLPIEAAMGNVLANRANHSEMVVLGRLRTGITPERGRTEIRTIARRLEQQYPDTNSAISANLVTLRERVSGPARTSLLVLWGAVCLVLLIACANIANLLLARSTERRRELAIRAALGAGRARLLRQLLIESLVLALAGAAIGLLLVLWSLKAAAGLLPAGLGAADLRLDWAVLLYTLLATLACALLFSLVPAWRSARNGVCEALKEGGRAGELREHGRLRDALVTAEVAVSLTLLVGAGLLGRSMYRLLHVDLGFQTDNLASVEVNVPFAFDFGRSQAFFAQVLERTQALPGVEAAAAATNFALAGGRSAVEVYREDRPTPARGHFPSIPYQVASPGYFRTVGIPLRRGRFFDSRDRGPLIPPGTDPGRAFGMLHETRLSAVINETMARTLWPGEDPIGRYFRFGTPELHGPGLEVVGVAGDTRQEGLETRPQASWYLCSLQFPLINGSTHLLLRSQRPATALGAEVRRMIAGIDPQIVVPAARTFDEIRDGVLSGRRTRTALLAMFAGLALLLALVGLYSVVSYAVAQRRHEFGVRMALGADQRKLVRLVMRHSMRPVLAGVACGLAGAVALTRALRGMLFEVQPGDPLTLAAVTLLLVATALAASLLPARRAARANPLDAMRCE